MRGKRIRVIMKAERKKERGNVKDSKSVSREKFHPNI